VNPSGFWLSTIARYLSALLGSLPFLGAPIVVVIEVTAFDTALAAAAAAAATVAADVVGADELNVVEAVTVEGPLVILALGSTPPPSLALLTKPS
jgi:hypothetical protein